MTESTFQKQIDEITSFSLKCHLVKIILDTIFARLESDDCIQLFVSLTFH